MRTGTTAPTLRFLGHDSIPSEETPFSSRSLSFTFVLSPAPRRSPSPPSSLVFPSSHSPLLPRIFFSFSFYISLPIRSHDRRVAWKYVISIRKSRGNIYLGDRIVKVNAPRARYIAISRLSSTRNFATIHR